MTDINKAIAFAKECLKWPHAHYMGERSMIHSGNEHMFYADDTDNLQHYLETFLGNRFFIQINRGTSSLFQWSVIVGLQDRTHRASSLEHGHAESSDLMDAIFDACVGAARLFPPT
jgi:hypothetical protein